MTSTAFIFGAGKTGRGFAAHLAFLGGYHIMLIDSNKQLVDDLNKEGQYFIQVLGNEEKSGIIPVLAAHHIEDASWHDAFITTGVAFTSVFGNNLEALSQHLAEALKKRYRENPEETLTIITCENLTNAAQFLKDCVLKNLEGQYQSWLSARVGFCEAIVFKTCLGPGLHQHPLAIRAQNFFELPCDADAIKSSLHIYGLKPLKNFRNQLRRKIYTYNCINAVITYLGAKKGYEQLYEAGRDEAIVHTAEKAAREASAALVAEFGFDPREQEQWVRDALAKFSDVHIPDPIERNGADPVRKLGRDDRLVGPALLAVKHGLHPEGLLAGIVACFEYKEPQYGCVMDLVRQKGIDAVLREVCGLLPEEELYTLIKKQIINPNTNDA